MPSSHTSDFTYGSRWKFWAWIALSLLSANSLANPSTASAPATAQSSTISSAKNLYTDAKVAVYASEARVAYLQAVSSLATSHVNSESVPGDLAIRNVARGQVSAFAQTVARYKQELSAQPIYPSLVKLEAVLRAGQLSGYEAAGSEVESARVQLENWRQGMDSAVESSLSPILAAGVPLPSSNAKPPKLVIYRPAYFNGRRIPLRVFVNDIHALTLVDNQYAAISLAPGTYTLRVQAFSALTQTAEVSLGMGDVGYVDTAVTESDWSLRSKVKPTDETTAKAALAQMSGSTVAEWIPVKPKD